MERRGFLLLVTTAVLALTAPGSAWAGDDDSGRGRGRGRGGDDGGGNSGSGSDDSGGDDNGGDDNSGSGGGTTDDDDDDDSSGTGSSTRQTSTGGGNRRPEVDADTVVLRMTDGSALRIRDGLFERVNASGRVVERRAADAADMARLGTARPGKGAEMLIRIDRSKGEIETVDRRGWRELIAHGTYMLTDPNGNVVKRRDARQSDVGRIGALVGS